MPGFFFTARDSDTNGALRTAIGSAGLLLSATAHHGHPTAQCRCGAGDHPKFVGTFANKDRSRYCRVSNFKVQRDYQQAIGKVIQSHAQ